jgi:hypothetical protein
MIELLAILLGLEGLASQGKSSMQQQGTPAGLPGAIPNLANNFNLPNASFGAGFVTVQAPSPPPGQAQLPPVVVSQVYAQSVQTNQTVQTPSGPVQGVTIISNNQGGLIGLASTPAQQQAVTQVFSKVTQQLRGLH